MRTLPRAELARFGTPPKPSAWWRLPQDARVRLGAIACALGWFGESELVVWRSGDWPHADWVDNDDDSSVVEFEIMRGVGAPVGTDALIEAGADDYPAVLTLAYCAVSLGWAPPHDLHVFAPQLGALVTLTHHDSLGVGSVDPQRVESLRAQISEFGAELLNR